MIMNEIAVPIAERVHKPSFIASFADKQFHNHSHAQVLVCRVTGKVPHSTCPRRKRESWGTDTYLDDYRVNQDRRDHFRVAYGSVPQLIPLKEHQSGVNRKQKWK